MKFLPYHAYEVCMSHACVVLIYESMVMFFGWSYAFFFFFYMTYAHILVSVLGSITSILARSKGSDLALSIVLIVSLPVSILMLLLEGSLSYLTAS